jgi:hypothetical protein
MWWMVAEILLAAALGLEARRLWRERIDETTGLRRYALYAVGHGDRPLRLIEVDAAGRSWKIEAAGAVAPQDRGMGKGVRPDATAVRTAPSGAIMLPFRSGRTALATPRRRIRR